MFFSVIIPVFNRSEEIVELLHSLCLQDCSDFEVIVVDDGSDPPCQSQVDFFLDKLPISYFHINNIGQGFARNFGIEKAQGQYFVFFDSDCVIPPSYFSILKKAIEERGLDAHGGPDAASDDFSLQQKAMDFAMTSLWTTGGIRGRLNDPAKFQARGFNMGFSAQVYQQVGGFFDPNRAEDIEISIRIKDAGFKLELVQEAYVYHKRKNSFQSFVRQGFNFGKNRVNVSRFHPRAIKAIHLLPSLFLLFLLALPFTAILNQGLFRMQILGLGFWGLAVLIHATMKHESLIVGFFALVYSISQLAAYGFGLLSEYLVKVTKG
ncbi:glycosyltransferase [Indibacter alkaliphilus]|uniref:glycosyltransferase n=1 Tax=Indibacter alkaliphilus TaxID=579922 RepID=UPI00058AFDBE|nr:glycosyltransferase [Indibacter alkaliphilus]